MTYSPALYSDWLPTNQAHYTAASRFPAPGFPLSVERTSQELNVPPHTHDFIEIAYVYRGGGTHRMLRPAGTLPAAPDEATDSAYADYPVSVGDVFVITPGEQHTYLDTEGLFLYNLLFLPKLLLWEQDYLARVPGLFNFLVSEPLFRYETGFRYRLHLPPAQRIMVEFYLDTIVQELTLQSPGFEIVAKGMTLACLGALGRGHAAQHNSQDALTDLRGKEQVIRQAVAFMEAHLDDTLSVEQIAEAVFLSPHYFSELFRRQTGAPPWEYLTSLRLYRAKALLQSTNLSIAEIALTAGFTDSSYFTRAFKAHIGLTPREFRKTGR